VGIQTPFNHSRRAKSSKQTASTDRRHRVSMSALGMLGPPPFGSENGSPGRPEYIRRWPPKCKVTVLTRIAPSRPT